MRWPLVITLSIGLNLAGWSLFGLWLGSAELSARAPVLHLSVMQLSPPRPRPVITPPPVVEPEPPRPVAEPPRPRPRPRPVQRVRTAPKPEPVKDVSPPEPRPQPSIAADPAPTGALAVAPPTPRAPTARSVRPAPVPRRAAPKPRAARKGPNLAALRARIRSAINRHRHYPRQARRRGIEGRVVLAFRLTPTGGVQSVKVVKSAGRLLDRAALAALRKATPLPYYPDWVRLPVVFVLED